MIKLLNLIMLGCWFLLLTPLGFAENEYFSKSMLDNGMTVLVNEMPSSSMVAIYAWIKTGSANEGKYIGTGITHFVEHMLFKGTMRRKAGDIPEEVRAMGGAINAATSHDFTVFTLTVPKENFAKGLDLLSDMVRNAAFEPIEVERERGVIRKEMKMVNDRPERKLDYLVYQTVYLLHPYQHPIIGHESLFLQITREQLLDYYKTHYVPNNMILSVAGGVTSLDVLAEARKVFEDFPSQPVPMRVLPQELPQVTPRFVAFEYPTELIRLVISYQGMPLFDKDLFAGDVLAMALGSGESSRFNQALHERKRLVEAIHAVNDTPMDRGQFEITALLSKDDVDIVLKEVQAILEDIKERGLKEDELEKVKRFVMAQNIYSRQTVEGVAHRAAMEEAFTGDARFSEKYLTGVKAVTNNDVKRMAKKYFEEASKTVVIMKPKVEVESERDPVDLSIRDGDPQLFVLPNGIKVVLKKDSSLPLVSVQALMRGGLREEPEERPGLAELTGRVWSRGVKGKTAEKLFREIESRAGHLSAGIGLDAFSISIDVLAEDILLALDDMKLLLLSPEFPESEIEKQKKDMLTAMQLRKDNIVQISFRGLYETLFMKHPLRRDPLGNAESLSRISRSDLVSFYEQSLSSKDLIIGVYGDIDIDIVKRELMHHLGGMSASRRQVSMVAEASLMTQRLKEIVMDKEQAFIVYGFHAPKADDLDKYSLQVAVNALSSSLGGRLFKRIRDELGKAYALSGGFSPGMDMGVCYFFVLTTEDNVNKVVSLIEEELKKAAEGGFSTKEIVDAKEYLKAEFARENQSISDQAGRDIRSEFYGLGHKAYQLYSQRIDAVTGNMAQEICQVYLNPSRAALVITRPKK